MQACAPDTLWVQNQLSLPMFHSHELAAREEQIRQEHARFDKRQAKTAVAIPLTPRKAKQDEQQRVTDLFDAIDDRVLDMPLGGPEEGNELNCEVDPTRVSDVETFELTDDAAVVWTDQTVEELHEAVLHYSLKLLQAKGNGAEKKEILRWIFAPELMEAKLTDPLSQEDAWYQLPNYATPFSFEQCCRICGYSSEKLMDGLVPILEEIGLGQIFKEVSNGNQNHS